MENERGFYHPSIGYWQTTEEPSEEILAAYPEGTIPYPLKPGDHYVPQDGGWVFQGPPPVDREVLLAQPLPRLDFWLSAAEVGVTVESVRSKVALIADPIERSKAVAFVEFSTYYRRNDPLLIAMAQAEGITPSQLDDLWVWTLA